MKIEKLTFQQKRPIRRLPPLTLVISPKAHWRLWLFGSSLICHDLSETAKKSRKRPQQRIWHMKSTSCIATCAPSVNIEKQNYNFGSRRSGTKNNHEFSTGKSPASAGLPQDSLYGSSKASSCHRAMTCLAQARLLPRLLQ